MAIDSLIDFVSVKNRGLRFYCLDEAVAQKLDGTAVRCMGKQFYVKPNRSFGDWYFVELNKELMGLSDDAIVGYFKPMGIPFMLTPSTKSGLIDSRARAVWFRSRTAPVQLFSEDRKPLREISFPDSRIRSIFNKNIGRTTKVRRLQSWQRRQQRKRQRGSNP